MSAIERLRALHDWAWTDPTWGASWPGEPEKRCPSCDCPWPCALPALLDVAEAARDARSLVFRGKQLTATPGHRDEGQRWLGDALNKLDAALARLDGAS